MKEAERKFTLKKQEIQVSETRTKSKRKSGSIRTKTHKEENQLHSTGRGGCVWGQLFGQEGSEQI